MNLLIKYEVTLAGARAVYSRASLPDSMQRIQNETNLKEILINLKRNSKEKKVTKAFNTTGDTFNNRLCNNALID